MAIKQVDSGMVYLWVLIFFFFFYFLIVRPWERERKLKRSSSYTIAKFIKKESVVEGGAMYTYVFYVEKIEYTDQITEDSRYDMKVGNCYDLKYYPPDPSCHELEYETPVDCNEFSQ